MVSRDRVLAVGRKRRHRLRPFLRYHCRRSTIGRLRAHGRPVRTLLREHRHPNQDWFRAGRAVEMDRVAAGPGRQ